MIIVYVIANKTVQCILGTPQIIIVLTGIETGIEIMVFYIT